jgi:hypothetical protein
MSTRYEGVGMSECIGPCFLASASRSCRWKRHRRALDSRLGEPELYGEVKIPYPSGTRTRPLGRQYVSSRYADCATVAVFN